MPSSFSFYIKRCMDDTCLNELDDVKRAWNTMIDEMRAECNEKKNAALSSTNSDPELSRRAVAEYEFTAKMLKNLESENAICEAFYRFVQQSYESSINKESAKAAIRAAIVESEKLKTHEETLKFWKMAQ